MNALLRFDAFISSIVAQGRRGTDCWRCWLRLWPVQMRTHISSASQAKRKNPPISDCLTLSSDDGKTSMCYNKSLQSGGRYESFNPPRMRPVADSSHQSTHRLKLVHESGTAQGATYRIRFQPVESSERRDCCTASGQLGSSSSFR